MAGLDGHRLCVGQKIVAADVVKVCFLIDDQIVRAVFDLTHPSVALAQGDGLSTAAILGHLVAGLGRAQIDDLEVLGDLVGVSVDIRKAALDGKAARCLGLIHRGFVPSDSSLVGLPVLE